MSTDAGVRAARNGKAAAQPRGLTVPRVFSREGVDPFDAVTWAKRVAEIKGSKGEVVYRQEVEAPEGWSDTAVKVAASKYFYGPLSAGNGSPADGRREHSVRQLLARVCHTIAAWGDEDGYFATEADAARFRDELTALCLGQYAAFNSPVWFNVGLAREYGLKGAPNGWRWDAGLPEGDPYDGPRTYARPAAAVACDDAYTHPQCSACFIQSVGDSMKEIMGLASAEAMLFKYGSGSGTDLSTLRSSREQLAGGGKPSGPVSFMRVYDAVAGAIKSGGKTRRAAKMQTLKCGHPDVLEFVTCKAKEERKAKALIAAGFDPDFNGEVYASAGFQNANLTLRVTNEFLRKATGEDADPAYPLRAVTTGEVLDKADAREVLRAVAEGTWECGDPGLQYEDTIQHWHTCPNAGPINSSNPCSEYMHLDDSACNLASLRLTRFLSPEGVFDVPRFRAAVRTLIVAQDILVDRASYPTARIAENAHRFRQLGLGYADLGALLMRLGLPYDSDRGRDLAAAITAVMTGQAYLTSAEVAEGRGAFDGHAADGENMLRVIRQHRDAAHAVLRRRCVETHPSRPPDTDPAAQAALVWDAALTAGETHGFRNAQATVLAPTGTIAFMMDCDTTGVEPDIALVKVKTLAGGGVMTYVNRSVRPALERLGYPAGVVDAIEGHVQRAGTVEGCPDLRPEHAAVFDTAFAPEGSTRVISVGGHLKMMAAVQPFISGAISKTVNLPESATVEDIERAYVDGWRLGLKALAVYRDKCKGSQPLAAGGGEKKPEAAPTPAPEQAAAPGPVRRKLPANCAARRHKFSVGGFEGYCMVGLYPDGAPGEVFVTMAREGSTLGGLMDAWATSLSIALQYGVPLGVLVDKFTGSHFEPYGFTGNRDVPIARSLVDYLARWLGTEFVPGYREAHAPDRGEPKAAPPAAALPRLGHTPACPSCGTLTVPNMRCHVCPNCGTTTGCS